MSGSNTFALCFFAVILLLSPFIFEVSAENRQQVRVSHVLDGDTVVLAKNERVRLIGINAPEKSHDSIEPYALEATLLLKDLIADKPVSIISAPEAHDRFGRTLAYIENADGVDVQMVLLEKGYAYALAYAPNVQRAEAYFSAEQRARESGKGIWAKNDSRILQVIDSRRINRGFQILTGKINHVSNSKKYVRMSLSDSFTLLITHQGWETYWQDIEPDDFIGKEVEVRGWVSGSRKSQILPVHHPLMMRIIE